MSDRRPQSAESLIGAVLGNYRITGELSSGGMGTVYRAQHELLDKLAAVKLLRPDLTTNAELVTRFFTEARAATAIRHPGIIEVYDFGHTEDGRAYLVMELLDGQSLSDRLAARGRLSELEAAQIVRGIASALTAAHGKGIVHRDLKPDNVFLVPDPDLPNGERPKVLDFGIAKLADPGGLPANVKHTATGALMGTPLYMAPEQARAAATIDHRADLYSLGCILYELLVGEPPFVAVGAGEIIALQLFGKPVPPSERLATVSLEMEHIAMRLLEKEPVDRFQSAADVSDALAAMLGRLSPRVSAQLAAGEPRTAVIVSTHPAAASSKLIVPIAEDASAPQRSRLPIVAALLTLGIAAVAVIAFASRGDDAPAAAPPAPPAPIAAPVASPPPPVVIDPPKPAPVVAAPQKRVTRPISPRDKCGKGAHTINCSPVEDTP